MTASDGELSLLTQMLWAKFPIPETEVRFLPGRRFRFDMAFPAFRVAVEVEGGTWVSGRHSRGAGFESDCVKYGEAQIAGWCVLRVTTGMVDSGVALGLVERALAARGRVAA